MNAQFSEAFNDVIREKRIDKSILMETLTAGFSSAAKKKFGVNAEVEVTEDKKGSLTLYLLKTVVSKVESPSSEITKDEAKEYDKKIKVGDTVKINIKRTLNSPEKFFKSIEWYFGTECTPVGRQPNS